MAAGATSPDGPICNSTRKPDQTRPTPALPNVPHGRTRSSRGRATGSHPRDPAAPEPREAARRPGGEHKRPPPGLQFHRAGRPPSPHPDASQGAQSIQVFRGKASQESGCLHQGDAGWMDAAGRARFALRPASPQRAIGPMGRTNFRADLWSPRKEKKTPGEGDAGGRTGGRPARGWQVPRGAGSTDAPPARRRLLVGVVLLLFLSPSV